MPGATCPAAIAKVRRCAHARPSHPAPSHPCTPRTSHVEHQAPRHHARRTTEHNEPPPRPCEGPALYSLRDVGLVHPPAAVPPQIPATIQHRSRLRRHDDRDPAAVTVGAQARDRRSQRRRDSFQAVALCRPAPRHRDRRRPLPLPDAEDHHRRVARHRVRRPQRVLCPPAADAAGVLPRPQDRRPDVARDQRPQRRADDDRSGGHVLRPTPSWSSSSRSC